MFIETDFKIIHEVNKKPPYNFRSLAEKKFASVLEREHISYLFEPFKLAQRVIANPLNNVDLGYTNIYTPDFFLSDLDLCIEVKSQSDSLTKKEHSKYFQFGEWLRKEQIRYLVLNLPYQSRCPEVLLSNFGHPEEMKELEVLLELANKTLEVT